jgi:hypothetical protein
MMALSLVLWISPASAKEELFACKSVLEGHPMDTTFYAGSIEEYEGKRRYAFGSMPNACRLASDPEPPAKSKETPFEKLAMGRYFNAIYNGDIDRVRGIDYEQLAERIGSLERQMGELGPIGRGIATKMQVDKATLVNPTVLTYAANYGDAYKTCLRKDAVEMIYTRKNSRETTVAETKYQMNVEFVKAFKETFQQPSIADLRNSSHPLIDISGGIQQMMAAFRCDDPVIKRFESRLLEMYSKVNAEPGFFKSGR